MVAVSTPPKKVHCYLFMFFLFKAHHGCLDPTARLFSRVIPENQGKNRIWVGIFELKWYKLKNQELTIFVYHHHS